MVSAAQNKSPYALTSVDNALRLVLLLQQREEIRLSEAATELGVANSTAHRLLATLAHRGFAVQDRSRSYRRGPALEPGQQSDLSIRFQETAFRHLQQLSVETQETTHLVVLEGNGTRFLDCVEGPQILRVGSRTGMLLPAHTNSGGKAMLACLTEGQLRALYPRGVPASPGRPATAFAELKRELAATRRRGYGVNMHESTRGVGAVGRHVCDATGGVLGALVVAGPTARCARSRLTELSRPLIATALRLEEELQTTRIHDHLHVHPEGTSPSQ